MFSSIHQQSGGIYDFVCSRVTGNLGLGAFEDSVLHIGVDSGTNVSGNSLSSVVL